MRLQYFFIQYRDNEYFCWPIFFKIMNFACISVWFGDESLHSKCESFSIGMLSFSIRNAFVFYWECFCFLLSCISKIILFRVGGYRCVQTFPVCFSACRLGSFWTDPYLFIQWVLVFTA